MASDTGCKLYCVGCGMSVVLPYTKLGHVSLKPLEGWTGPPLRCPECSRQLDHKYYEDLVKHRCNTEQVN